MSLKPMIEKLDDVVEPLRELYKQREDGKFYIEMDLTSHPDVLAIKKNKDEILNEKKELQRKFDEQQAKLRDDQVKGHISAQEFDQAKALLQNQFDETTSKLTAERDTLKTQLKSNMIDNVVIKMASELAGDNAHLLEGVLRGRLEIVEKDGLLKLFVKDASGNISNMTADQLQKEIGDDKRYAAVVKGRNSSGGNSNSSGSGGSGESEFEKYFKQGQDYSLTKQVELEKANPALYKELAAKYNPLAKHGFRV
jgi:hypothetical protein